MALDERSLFTEKPETRPGRYQCPKCRRTGEYSIRWVRRSKKDRLPAGADEGDRAKFAKLRDYLLRLDDEVTCKTCGKKFEIPSQHSLMFVDQLAGLPNEEDLERGDQPRVGRAGAGTREQAGAACAVHAQVERLEVAQADGREAALKGSLRLARGALRDYPRPSVAQAFHLQKVRWTAVALAKAVRPANVRRVGRSSRSVVG